MASAAGLTGVRATLESGRKSSTCVECEEPDSARPRAIPEIMLLASVPRNALFTRDESLTETNSRGLIQFVNECIGDLSLIEKEDRQGQTRFMSITAVVARAIRWFSSIRCDNDLANGPSRFKEIVGGSHRFWSKP
jgi:hypothetical protein